MWFYCSEIDFLKEISKEICIYLGISYCGTYLQIKMPKNSLMSSILKKINTVNIY